MAGFAQAFGDALTDMPTGKASEVAFGSTQTWAGVPFEFRHGASTDFPGASILIGGKVYYGGAAKADAVQFKISYLNTVKKLLAENSTPEAFVEAMKKAYPGLPGEAGLEAAFSYQHTADGLLRPSSAGRGKLSFVPPPHNRRRKHAGSLPDFRL